MTYCTYQYIANKNNRNYCKSKWDDIIPVIKVIMDIELFS